MGHDARTCTTSCARLAHKHDAQTKSQTKQDLDERKLNLQEQALQVQRDKIRAQTDISIRNKN